MSADNTDLEEDQVQPCESVTCDINEETKEKMLAKV